MSRRFTWDAWNFDYGGDAYIIAKAECPKQENVSDYIIQVDNLSPNCRAGMEIEDGWCKFQVRTDWANYEGEPLGGYYVEQHTKRNNNKKGWFPVWIVRKGDWY